MSKLRWADMTDDYPEPEPEPEPSVIVTKHGVKVSYVPPHLRPPSDKTKTPLNNKK
jgi:hypothetical protein